MWRSNSKRSNTFFSSQRKAMVVTERLLVKHSISLPLAFLITVESRQPTAISFWSPIPPHPTPFDLTEIPMSCLTADFQILSHFFFPMSVSEQIDLQIQQSKSTEEGQMDFLHLFGLTTFWTISEKASLPFS